jgi:energy-coupling factor transporter ATP-binding protein EcfA2
MKMPMQQLSISGFRGATKSIDFTFEDKPVVMIFGENGTGKSTIVDAIDFICNECGGPLEGRQSTPVKEYLPSLGGKAADLKVQLKWAAKTWNATLDGAKAKVVGGSPRPKARILRRPQILEIVDAQPAKRYEAFSRFVAVPKVEQSENALREAVRTVGSEFDAAARSLSEAQTALKKLQTEAGASTTDLMKWAKVKNDVDPKDLTARTQHISALLSSIQATKIALSGLSLIRGQAAADAQSVQSLTIDLQAAEEQSEEAKNDLLKLLDVAADYLAAHEEQDSCPVCEQPIDRAELIVRLTARKATGAAVIAASAQLDIAKKAEDRRQTLVKDAHTRFLTASANLLKEFRQSESPAVANKKIDWAAFPLVQDTVADELADAAEQQAQTLLTACEQCDPALQIEKTTVLSELEVLRAIKLQYGVVVKSGKQAKAQEVLIKRLKAVLDIVEAQRKAFVDQALASIAKRVDALYAKLHPGEKLGDIKLQLDPNKRGSMNVSSRFESKTGIPPQAYYSEAHLDTLGICIFIALAEKDVASDTLLVLDDVLTSADQPHVDRFISVVHEELKLPVLITTHYRPWRDRYRYATGPVGNVHLIELLSWTQERGVRHTKTKLEIDELKLLLAAEPIDRQGLASKAGVLLEAALRELCLLYKCKMSFNAEGQHTLGEYLNGIDSKLRKLMKCVTNTNGASASSVSQTTIDILPLLAAVDSMAWIRNQVGAHFNLAGMDLTDSQIAEFAKSTSALLDTLICLQCGELPRKNTGSFFSCGCKTRELHPLTSPGAQPAQTGN